MHLTQSITTVVLLAAAGAVAQWSTTYPGDPCTPGRYRCNGNSIQVCTGSGQWVLSAICSDRGCVGNNGNPYCV